MVTSTSAIAHVPASPATVWAALVDPRQHRRFDGTGMVGAPDGTGMLTSVGDLFVMNMTYRGDAEVEHYQSDNHVTIFEPCVAIAWRTATHGGEPLGWEWRYDLAPDGDGTRVCLSYDWTDADESARRRFGVPLTDAAGLARSLRLLRDAVTDCSQAD